jgi:predicted molibdopterin-dependent oxidoreductase YjgC
MSTLTSPVVSTVSFELDGQPLQAHEGETILQVAIRAGVDIPHLCFSEGLRPDGNCRACVVEIAGERVLAPSCCRAVTPGMKVQASSERARKSQALVLEMLLADLPAQGHKWNDGPESLITASADTQERSQQSLTCLTRPWRSTLTPAFNAPAAFAPVARCRSMM